MNSRRRWAKFRNSMRIKSCRFRRVLLASLALGFFWGGPARAGPPFLTDDPEPVETGHWEFYTAFQWLWARHGASGTCPHFEVNYGARPNLQLHAIVPAALSANWGEQVFFGLGDVELGVKLRFVSEGEWRPQIGIFPLVDLPTGSEIHGLGAGTMQGLLPVWLQKSFGPWTTYGGGGFHVAADNHKAVFGWMIQREITHGFTLGTEAFLTIPETGETVQTQLNLGFILDFSERNHLLFSAGPSFGGDAPMQTYLAYQLTI